MARRGDEEQKGKKMEAVKVVLPGDLVLLPSSSRAQQRSNEDPSVSGASQTEQVAQVKIGSGVVVIPDGTIMATKRGIARTGMDLGVMTSGNKKTSSNRAARKRRANAQRWVEGRSRWYTPAPGDNVVGVVIERFAEHFSVNIGSSSPALLPLLAFEGATRRNRPNLKSGALVYARVTSASRDIEAELACVDEDGRSSGYGELKDEYGYVIHVNTCDARALLWCMSNNNDDDDERGFAQLVTLKKRLKAVGEATPFEMIVGMNGRIWICAKEAGTVLRLARDVLAAFDS